MVAVGAMIENTQWMIYKMLKWLTSVIRYLFGEHNVYSGYVFNGNLAGVRMVSGKVIVNGKQIGSNKARKLTITVDDGTEIFTGNLNIEIHADSVESVECCGELNIVGNCGSVHTSNGNIHIDGDVFGNVKADMGNINCANVGGSVKTSMGNIRHR